MTAGLTERTDARARGQKACPDCGSLKWTTGTTQRGYVVLACTEPDCDWWGWL